MNLYTYLRTKYVSEEGATATEYVFLLAFIALVIIVAVTALGNALSGEFNEAATTLNGASN